MGFAALNPTYVLFRGILAQTPAGADMTKARTCRASGVASHATPGFGLLIDALAIHCEVPVNAIKNIVRQESDMGMLVLRKASGMGWPDLQGIVSVTLPAKTKTPDDVRALFASFRKLTLADAQRSIRFIRTSTAKSLDTLKELV